jgi:hypothetical protein
MSNFEIAFYKLSTKDQATLTHILEQWKTYFGPQGEKIVENFRKEHFLSVKYISELFQYLIQNQAKGAEMLIRAVRQLIYDRYQLKGECIQVEQPKLVGFAMGKEDYKDYLMRSSRLKYFDDDESEVDKFLANCALNLEDYADYDMLFKNDFKLVWLTWDEYAHDDPFNFMQYRLTSEVCITLGLDERYFNPPLYLFVVEAEKVTESGFELSRPTFCDADFFEKFSPTPLGFKLFGRTVPLQDRIHDKAGNYYEPIGQPEAVVRSKYLKFNNLINIDYLSE